MVNRSLEQTMKRKEDFMRVIVLALAAAVAATPVAADYLVREIGSFHVGGRTETLSGLPTKDIVFSSRRPADQGRPQRRVRG